MKKKSFWINLVFTICIFIMTLGFSSCVNIGQDMESNIYDITENYTNISIEARTADFHILKVEGEQTSVSCYEYTKAKHTVEVVEDTLVIKVVDTRKWYEKIFNFKTPSISITMPSDKNYGDLSVKATTSDLYVDKGLQFKNIDIKLTTGDVKNYASADGDVNIEATTGDIRVENVSANQLNCSVSTGDIAIVTANCANDIKMSSTTGKMRLTNVLCKNFTADGRTGDIILTSVLAEEKLYIEGTTSDVKFDRCDAAEIEVKVTTGDVRGTLRSDKIFIIESNTGEVKVPETTTGGVCKIKVTTGDIKISIYEE